MKWFRCEKTLYQTESFRSRLSTMNVLTCFNMILVTVLSMVWVLLNCKTFEFLLPYFLITIFLNGLVMFGSKFFANLRILRVRLQPGLGHTHLLMLVYSKDVTKTKAIPYIRSKFTANISIPRYFFEIITRNIPSQPIPVDGTSYFVLMAFLITDEEENEDQKKMNCVPVKIKKEDGVFPSHAPLSRSSPTPFSYMKSPIFRIYTPSVQRAQVPKRSSCPNLEHV